MMITPPATSPSPFSSVMPRRISGPIWILRHIAQAHRHAGVVGRQRDLPEVIQATCR